MFGLVVTIGISRADDVLSVTYPASDKPGELAMAATFHVWIPPQAKRIRAVIVHQHGCGAGAERFGDRAALDLHWRALAARHDAALLSPHYHSRGADCRLWCDPRNGSDAIFRRALADLAGPSRHPELATAPWCLWGHSGGGFWVSLMLEKHPERILAAFCRSGAVMTGWLGETPDPQFPAAAFDVPVLLNPGLLERDDARFAKAWQSTSNFFALFRAKDAPVILSVKRTRDGVALTWTAEADLESGIRQFAVYRDGQWIALWPEKPDEKTGYALFQGISYHDTPVSPHPAFAFTDRAAPAGPRPA